MTVPVAKGRRWNPDAGILLWFYSEWGTVYMDGVCLNQVTLVSWSEATNTGWMRQQNENLDMLSPDRKVHARIEPMIPTVQNTSHPMKISVRTLDHWTTFITLISDPKYKLTMGNIIPRACSVVYITIEITRCLRYSGFNPSLLGAKRFPKTLSVLLVLAVCCFTVIWRGSNLVQNLEDVWPLVNGFYLPCIQLHAKY